MKEEEDDHRGHVSEKKRLMKSFSEEAASYFGRRKPK